MFKTKSENSSLHEYSDGTESFVHIMDNIDIANETTLDLKVTPRHNTVGLEAKHVETHFCATVTARDLPDDDAIRAPVDIIVALDTSGSMSGRKLERCKETLTLLLRELSARDRFSLVTFGNDAKIQIPTRKLTNDNKQIAIEKIKSLRSSGGTNLSGGIGLAAQEWQSIESPNEVQTIFLLTDGLANRGIFNREGIVQLVKGCLALETSQAPVAIHCFGYGSDHDREMLRDISQVTEGGTYYFVENDSDVSSAFGDAIGGLLSVVAQNTVLTFTASNEFGIRINGILHDKAIKHEDGSFTVGVGDFYAGESRDIVCSIALASGSDFGIRPVPHISVSMTYMDTIDNKLANCKAVEGSISRPNGCEVSQVNKHVALQYIRVSTANIIADAEKIASGGSREDATTKIKSHIEYLSRESTSFGFSESNPLIFQLLSDLNGILSGLSSEKLWHSGGACYMQTRIQKHRKQRSSESKTSATMACPYSSPKQKKMCLALQD